MNQADTKVFAWGTSISFTQASVIRGLLSFGARGEGGCVGGVGLALLPNCSACMPGNSRYSGLVSTPQPCLVHI